LDQHQIQTFTPAVDEEDEESVRLSYLITVRVCV
jgi:hypothetical protein